MAKAKKAAPKKAAAKKAAPKKAAAKKAAPKKAAAKKAAPKKLLQKRNSNLFLKKNIKKSRKFRDFFYAVTFTSKSAPWQWFQHF